MGINGQNGPLFAHFFAVKATETTRRAAEATTKTFYFLFVPLSNGSFTQQEEDLWGRVNYPRPLSSWTTIKASWLVLTRHYQRGKLFLDLAQTGKMLSARGWSWRNRKTQLLFFAMELFLPLALSRREGHTLSMNNIRRREPHIKSSLKALVVQQQNSALLSSYNGGKKRHVTDWKTMP